MNEKIDVEKEIDAFLAWHRDPQWAHAEYDYAHYLRNLINRIINLTKNRKAK